ncbi:hypothetical protein [Aquirhabdus parva]|uniref:Lipoprotein n=1 Tax=Aquirhabdus parva TaxID=2283318 RepID=A0A345P8B4_9GAMM|nr:hypothetical protein [Aquirhabdus parva]AXI03523.1 hypothetical protein HYN46_12145 [Aquirhabdus parva]
MLHNKKMLLIGLTASILLSGCGGGTGDAIVDAITPPALTDGAGGRFYGYYVQSADTADTPSTVGGMYLSLPNSEGGFNGRMSYQFFDCQRTNALQITGQKTTAYLTGKTVGSLDTLNWDQLNPTFAATFSGSYSRATDNYSGKYNRIDKSGDDRKTVNNCGSYTVADKGTWQVYKDSVTFPNNFALTQTGDLINWTFVSNATRAVVLIVDPSQVDSSNNAVVRQIIAPATTLITNAVNNNVARGQQYLAVVELFDINNTPVAFKTLAVKF